MKNPNAPRTTSSLALTEKHTSPVCERANLPYPIGGVNPPFGGSPYFLGMKAKRAKADRPHRNLSPSPVAICGATGPRGEENMRLMPEKNVGSGLHGEDSGRRTEGRARSDREKSAAYLPALATMGRSSLSPPASSAYLRAVMSRMMPL